MSGLGTQINFRQLLQRHGCIRIPMIQRDYAQGRPAETEVREEFLNALEEALRKPTDDPTLPLNLDFIYGSVEGDSETRFLPLDGQQRLTTLFLLHWYFAWKDQQWGTFVQMFQADRKARFAYSVRPSSNEFFDELVAYHPNNRPENVPSLSRLISDQSWYFRSWRLDPTIQSVLCMLDAIHDRFSSLSSLFARLVDESHPAITFQLLDLNNFGLSDDLYIKMNARGKPLTPFETFKARYEQELKNQFGDEVFPNREQNFSASDYIARRMDTVWADLFWAHRDQKSNLYDEAVMNVFRAIALVTREPENSEYLQDVAILRSSSRPPTYSDFHSRGWLDRRFTLTLMRLLNAWSARGGTLSTLLPNSRYFDEITIFRKVVTSGGNLPYGEVVQFFAYASFITEHYASIDAEAFQEWMRIVFNLSANTPYDRSTDLQRSINGVQKLLCESNNILTYFAKTEKPVTGFFEQQVEEEKLKAELILGNEDWRPIIDRAESHGYLRGQIEFLFDFCQAISTRKDRNPNAWEPSLHSSLQKNCSQYLSIAELMFGPQGLKSIEAYRWERALLSLGNYLLPSRRNFSFLVNSVTDQASWKRLLRGTGPLVPQARKILKELWERLSPDQSLKDQLDRLIESSTDLEPWREAIVRTPEAIEYCQGRSIRREASGSIYILKRTQMNGEHVELFTFCLYVKIKRIPDFFKLFLATYKSAIDTYAEPHLQLAFEIGGKPVLFKVEFQAEEYCIQVEKAALDATTTLRDELSKFKFYETGKVLQKTSSRANIEGTLTSLDLSLFSTFQQEQTHA